MQNSELFRRGVVLPLDLDAEKLLRLNSADEATRVRYLEIENQQEFEVLWKSGVFQRINAIAESFLDDYEEDFLDVKNMSSILTAIEDTQITNKVSSVEEERFMIALSSMASEAASLGRPLLFVL